jgi:hypothetical protein
MEINSNNLINTSLLNKDIKLNDKTDEQLKAACDEFESFFLRQFMDISLKSTKVAGEGAGSDIIKGMYSETMANNSNGTAGISDLLYGFLSKNNK